MSYSEALVDAAVLQIIEGVKEAGTLIKENKRLRRQRDNYRRAIQSTHAIYPGSMVNKVYGELEDKDE